MIVVSGFLLDDGSAIAVGTVIAEADHGKIYQVLGQSDGAVKLFDAATPEVSTRLDKVAAMIASPLAAAVADDGFVTMAWPRRLVLDDGRPAGYLMPRIDAPPLAGIYGRTWSHRVATAVNLCEVVNQMHGAGIVLGDLQDTRILVSDNDRITLIDCDAAQFVDTTGRFFLAPAARGDFTAPELASVDLTVARREKSSDLFGLAVNIHLLLTGGVHPFRDGLWIGEGAQPDPLMLAASGNWSGGPASRFATSPFAPSATFLPVQLQELFDRAFADGARDPALRPSAVEWREALRRIEIKSCTSNPEHEMPVDAARCPWCAPAGDHDPPALSSVAQVRPYQPRTKWLIAVGASLVAIAVLAIVVFIKYYDKSGPSDASAGNSGRFTGSYSVSYGPKTDLEGAPRNAEPMENETWHVRSACDTGRCEAVASRRHGEDNIEFDQVGGRWIAVAFMTVGCQGLPSASAWVAYSLRPQADGTLSGISTVETANGCLDEWTVTFSRTDQADSGNLPDPAGLPRRVVSLAERLHGRYHLTETGQGLETADLYYRVDTVCPRTGTRCMSMFHSPQAGPMAFVFDDGRWTWDIVDPRNTCSDGRAQTVRWTTVVPMPPAPADPILQLSGHGHLAILQSNGGTCNDADYDVQITRTGD